MGDEEMAKALEQARRYHEYAYLARMVHYRMSDVRARVNQIVGGLTVLAAAVVSTGILSSVKTNHGVAFKLAGGIIAFVATVLAGVQSFYKFGEVGEKHRTAAADYGNVMREIELFLTRYAAAKPEDEEAALAELEQIGAKLCDLDKKGPGYPGSLYERIRRRNPDQQEPGARSGSSAKRKLIKRRADALFKRGTL